MAADETEAARRREALARIEGRSPLHDWLRSNRAELEAQFAAVGRPRWASVAKVLAELGVRDAKGQPPNPQTVRQAWVKVRASSPAPAKGAAPSASVAQPTPPASVPPTAAPVPSASEASPDPPRPRFKLGSLR